MKMSLSGLHTAPVRSLTLCLCIPVLMVLSGCGSSDDTVTSETSNYQVAKGTPDSVAEQPSANPVAPAAPYRSGAAVSPPGVAPEKPSSEPPPAVNPEQPRSNRPEDVLAFLREIQTRPPRGVTRDEQMVDLQKTQNQIISLADQLLSGQVEDLAQEEAAGAKLSALMTLEQLGGEGMVQRAMQFCKELQQSPKPGLAQLGRRVGFAIGINQLQEGGTSSPDSLVAEFQRVVAGEVKDARLIEMARSVAMMFDQSGNRDQALQVLQITTQAFQAANDPTLVEQVASLHEQAKLIEVDLGGKLNDVYSRKPGSTTALVQAAQQLLTSNGVGSDTVSQLRENAYMLEGLDPKASTQLYSLLGQRFQNHPDQELSALVMNSVTLHQRRSNLIGKPFQVEGVTLDGQPFDWSQYQGKVVLVDFWATWCGPCLAEIPNIQQSYERYKESGFEVVGVNLDDSQESVQLFFSRQTLPWPTVVSADPTQRGYDSPLAVQSGMEYIPFIVLVGRDGNVVALNVRGEQLEPKLRELLGLEALGDAARIPTGTSG